MNNKTNSILWLNGAAGSGKTSIALGLQERLEEIFLHIKVDDYQDMLPSRLDRSGEEYWNHAEQYFSGFHNSILSYYNSGANIIVDHVLVADPWKRECSDLFRECGVVFIGVMCDIDELEKREKKRNDWRSQLNLARFQIDRVHKNLGYDIEVDTGRYSTDECVSRIIEAVESGNTFKGIQYNP